MKPKILCVLGLSGSGKSSLETDLCKLKNFKKVTSCATRSPRDNEEDGKDYYFISEKQFEYEYKNGNYVEIGGKYGGRYAVRNSEIVNDKINVLVTAKDGLDELLYTEDYDIIAIWTDCEIEERFKRISSRNSIKYALERIEKDGFRREEEIKTCKYIVDTTKLTTNEVLQEVIKILDLKGWYYDET